MLGTGRAKASGYLRGLVTRREKAKGGKDPWKISEVARSSREEKKRGD